MKDTLGLDLSSSTVGWTLLDKTGKVKGLGYLDLKKETSLYRKLDLFKVFIKKFAGKDISIFIEEPVKVYSTSTAYTISLLQRWNRICLLLRL